VDNSCPLCPANNSIIEEILPPEKVHCREKTSAVALPVPVHINRFGGAYAPKWFVGCVFWKGVPG